MFWLTLKTMFALVFCWFVFMVVSDLLFHSVAVGFFGFPIIVAVGGYAMFLKIREKRAQLQARVDADIAARARQLVHEIPANELGIVDLDS